MKKLICGAAITAALIAVGIYFNRPIVRFTLSDGSEVSIFYLGYGEKHEFDLRPLPIKTYELLPWSIRNRITWAPLVNYDWASLNRKGSNDLGIGLRYKKGTNRSLDLYEDMKWVLSDNSGWHFSGFESGVGVGEHAQGAVFRYIPRSKERLKLSLFTKVGHFEAGDLLGAVEFPNPAYIANAAQVTATDIPKEAGGEDASVELLGFYTGLSFPEIPLQLANRPKVLSTNQFTSGIEELINNQSINATFPDHARSCLVFIPRFDGKPNSAALRHVDFSISESTGLPDTFVRGILYKGNPECVLLWDYNLPIDNGNYAIELTLFEDPPTSTSSWVQMAPLKPNVSDLKSTQVIAIGANTLHAGMTRSNSRIDFTATEDPSSLSVRAVHTESSVPLKLSTLQGGSWRAPYHSYVELSQPVTSGTVTLHIAKSREHKIMFSGVPMRAEDPLQE